MACCSDLLALSALSAPSAPSAASAASAASASRVGAPTAAASAQPVSRASRWAFACALAWVVALASAMTLALALTLGPAPVRAQPVPGGPAAAVAPASGSAVAALGFQVVAHPDFRAASLTRGELAALFMGTRRSLDDGSPVQVIDAADAALREQFYGVVAGRSAVQMHAHWSRVVFSGAGRPPPQADVALTLAVLRREPGSLAYLPPGQDLRGLRLVQVIDRR